MKGITCALVAAAACSAARAIDCDQFVDSPQNYKSCLQLQSAAAGAPQRRSRSSPGIQTNDGNLQIDVPPARDVIFNLDGDVYSLKELIARIGQLEAQNEAQQEEFDSFKQVDFDGFKEKVGLDRITDQRATNEKIDEVVMVELNEQGEKFSQDIADLRAEHPFKLVDQLGKCNDAQVGATRMVAGDGFFSCLGGVWERFTVKSSLGLSAASPAESCKVILAAADYTPKSGNFWLTVNGQKRERYCVFGDDGEHATDMGGTGRRQDNPVLNCDAAVNLMGGAAGNYFMGEGVSGVKTYCSAEGEATGCGQDEDHPGESCAAIFSKCKSVKNGKFWIGSTQLTCTKSGGVVTQANDGSMEFPYHGATKGQRDEHCVAMYSSNPERFTGVDSGKFGEATGKVTKDDELYFSTPAAKTVVFDEFSVTKPEAEALCQMRGGELADEEPVYFSDGTAAFVKPKNFPTPGFSWKTNEKLSPVGQRSYVHGLYGNDHRTGEATVDLPQFKSGERDCTLNAVMYATETRDNERDRIYWNGKEVMNQQVRMDVATANGRSTGKNRWIDMPWNMLEDLTEGHYYTDKKPDGIYYMFQGTVRCKAENTIRMYSEIDESISNEGWGFFNVEVWFENDLIAVDYDARVVDYGFDDQNWPKSAEPAMDVSKVKELSKLAFVSENIGGAAHDKKTIGWHGSADWQWTMSSGYGSWHGRFDYGEKHQIGDVHFDYEFPCIVQWISLFFDSRDNEWEQVHFNGKRFMYTQASWNCGGVWSRLPRSYIDRMGIRWHWGPIGCYFINSHETTCKAGRNRFEFRSAIDQHEHDESWGFTNVQIRDVNGNIVANDRHRFMAEGWDKLPEFPGAQRKKVSHDLSIPFWTKATEGTGAKFGYACTFNSPFSDPTQTLVPFTCTCPGTSTQAKDCHADP